MRLVFQRKVVSKPGQADQAIQFVKAGDPGAEDVPPEKVLVKDTEKRKFRPKSVVKAAHDAGYRFLGFHVHALLWQRMNAKDPSLGYGVEVEGQWYWYEKWIDEVLRHCASVAKASKSRPKP